MSSQSVVNFNGGEFSPKIDVRSDTEKYASGCRTLENMWPLVFGGAERRTGTEFISTRSDLDTIVAGMVALSERS